MLAPLSAHNPACLNSNQQHFVATGQRGSRSNVDLDPKQFQTWIYLCVCMKRHLTHVSKTAGSGGNKRWLVFWLLL